MQVPTDPSQHISLARPVSNGTTSDAQGKLESSGGTERLPEGAEKQPARGRVASAISTIWQNWSPALKGVLPIYILIHLALFVIASLAFLFVIPDSSSQILPLSTLWQQWYHWDSGYYLRIAQGGYTGLHEMAFFPLFPLVERAAIDLTQNTYLGGLLVSNLAELVMFMALYRLVAEDFDGERAYYSILYFAIFPTAFFFSAAFSESLFLTFAILGFYNIRHGRWWPAALFGFLASLTRPDGMYLTLPFCYEYLRRSWELRGGSTFSLFSRTQLVRLLKSIRADMLIGLCLPGGILIFMIYGYYQFQDPLAFVHAHAFWNRSLHFPGWNMLKAFLVIFHHRYVSFLAMRSAIDLGTDLFVLLLLLSIFIGPWKLPKSLWSYGLYAAPIYLYFQLFPRGDGLLPLESMSRFLLELFPAFIMLARISKHRTLSLGYILISGSLLFFLLTQFLTNHWVP